MYLDLGDGHLYYKVTGRGKPLILLHGNFNDHQIWNEQVEQLTESYQVIRYDLRGYGRSSTPTVSFSNVDDLKALIDFLKLDQVTLVGSSLGGGVAIDFTLTYPHLIHRLILACPSINGHRLPLRMTWQGIKNFYITQHKGKERAIEAFIDNPFWQYYFPASAKEEAVTKVLQNVRNVNNFCRFSPNLSKAARSSAIGRLDEITAPTLIIISDQDHPYNLQSAQLLHAKLRHSTKMIMQNCRHLPFVENPSEFNKAVLNFLA